MDPISQGALGAALSASVARREEIRPALALGALAGMAADLDVLVRSSADPLLALEYHRHFTHALAFAPLGALVCAATAWFLVRRHLTFGRTYLYCLLGYSTHGVLDACTSWGTALLWPFSDTRTAWNVVAVVDPLFTLPLAGFLVFAAVRRLPRVAAYALLWAGVYLSGGLLQRERAEDAARTIADSRGHALERVIAKPAFGNIVLWKTVYATTDDFHVDAVRLGPHATLFPGDSVPRLDVTRDLRWLDPVSTQAEDVERFRRFSDDYVSLADRATIDVVDVRYSMVPNQIDALWGIRLDPAAPAHAHAEFIVRRDATPAHRAALVELLFGPGE